MTDRVDFIADLTPVIGEKALLALVAACGGTTVQVPKKPAGMYYDVLVAAVGEPAAVAIVAHVGPHALFVPRCKAEIARQRWKRIQDDLDAKMPVAEVARKYAVSDRWIYKIAKIDATPRQHGLFDD
jgi:hypothetical protein